jgi:hypothetical protein
LDKQKATELVSVDAARAVEPKVPSPDALALKELENSHSKSMHTLSRGWIGACIGSGNEKPGNTAFLVIVCCFAFIGISVFKFDIATQFEQFFKFVTLFFGPVGLALGYLFGSRDKN